MDHIHSFGGIRDAGVAVVVHGAGDYLTVSWPVGWVKGGCGDVGGGVGGGVAGGVCWEGVGPKRGDGGDDALDRSG